MVSHSKSSTGDVERALKSTVLDANGKATAFGTLLSQQSATVKRTLVVFIRHFFCGNCQEYVRRLVADLPPSTLPDDLSIIIIGCGAPSLISSYLEVTTCPFTLYADPSTQLYKLLGMQRSLSLGSKGPAYIQHSLASGVVKSVVQGLKRIPTGDAVKGGDLSVNGGEYLFTRSEFNSNWTVSWSHRMLNSRDHSEVSTLKQHLGILSISQGETAESKMVQNETPTLGQLPCTSDVCGLPPSRARRSSSTKRRSWMIRAGHLTRSPSFRQSMIHV